MEASFHWTGEHKLNDVRNQQAELIGTQQAACLIKSMQLENESSYILA